MKIGIISDLHVDQNNPGQTVTVQEALARVAIERRTDLLLVAGDIANSYEACLTVLEEIETRSGVPCLFVPGNHDIWNLRHPSLNASGTYEALKRFPRNLAGGAYHINDEWVVIGDIGWYDFSLGSTRFTKAQFEEMEYDGRAWQDKIFAQWDRPTTEIHDWLVDKLEAQLERYRDRKIIFVTHVVPHEQFTVPTPHPVWDYFNAFLGSRAYGSLIERYTTSIPYAVCGHVHYRKRFQWNETEMICNCLGYRKEWRHGQSPYDEIAQALVTIDIDA